MAKEEGEEEVMAAADAEDAVCFEEREAIAGADIGFLRQSVGTDDDRASLSMVCHSSCRCFFALLLGHTHTHTFTQIYKEISLVRGPAAGYRVREVPKCKKLWKTKLVRYVCIRSIVHVRLTKLEEEIVSLSHFLTLFADRKISRLAYE